MKKLLFIAFLAIGFGVSAQGPAKPKQDNAGTTTIQAAPKSNAEATASVTPDSKATTKEKCAADEKKGGCCETKKSKSCCADKKTASAPAKP